MNEPNKDNVLIPFLDEEFRTSQEPSEKTFVNWFWTATN